MNVADSNGCSASDVLTVTVNDLSGTYVPTAFSPNGDGINDYFTIFADQSIVEVLSLKVFDRWGGLLFEKTNFPHSIVGGAGTASPMENPLPLGPTFLLRKC